MARNSIGQIFRVISFGESHGNAVGTVIEGCPAGLELDLNAIRFQMKRRRPGQNAVTSARDEADEVQIISGVYENTTTGSPIALMIPNQDAKSSDYEALKNVYRPGHADYTYEAKYGIRDYRGGGRSSARITAGWVAAGTIAEQLLFHNSKISIVAFVNRVRNIELSAIPDNINRDLVDASAVRCPDKAVSEKMEAAILDAKNEGDSVGGSIICIVKNCPVGIGEPVFGKLHAELGKVMFSINAVKAVEIGDGIGSTYRKGSENNDAITAEAGSIKTITNTSGGIQGGISNGEDIIFTVHFKPTSTIAKPQQTVNTSGENMVLEATGRHDPCVLPRAVPIVESLTAIVLADFWLEHKLSSI